MKTFQHIIIEIEQFHYEAVAVVHFAWRGDSAHPHFDAGEF